MRYSIVELGDVIDIYDSKRIPLSSIQRQKRPGKYPYYGASGVIDYIDDYIFDGEYLLVAEDGENLRSRNLPIVFWAKGKFWVNNHAHIILGKNGKAYTDFIRHYLSNADISGYITGAAQPKLSQANLKIIKINLPTYPTQQKIASILSAYDDLVENNTRRLKIMEEMAQALYKEWFVNFCFPGHEKVKFVDSSLGKIPEGWGVRKLGDIIELAYGKGLKSESRIEGDFPVYGSSGVVGSHNEYLVNGPGVIVGRKGNVGSVFYSSKSFFPIDTTFYVKSELNLLYIFYLLSNMSFINNDAAVPGLNRNAALLKQVICPSKNLIKDFSNHIQAIFNLTETLKQKIQNLRKTRDLLLPKLMSGEVEV